ncbi:MULTISPECIES: O-antigen polymerase [Heyndrickxia]|uniref:O-antigen polymerase n=1 Tax=Heyndrickxia TaxID=2837504 RepID=UPI002DBF0EA8|nr:O-antigen polymerase [Weizmannia sp. CD-2023]MEC2306273.1 O-antigen ligase [Weizmannia sp. CD-2023]MEC2340582.1 O-antigen ligase [Weizmannia sp. CD-2023]
MGARKNLNIKLILLLIFLVISFVSILAFMIEKCKYGLIIDLEVTVLGTFFLGVLLFSKDYLNPFVIYYIYSFLGFLDIVFVIFDLRITRFIQTESIYQKTLFIMILWFFAFSLGYFILGRIQFSENKRRFIHLLDNFNLNIKITIWAIVILMFFVLFKLVLTASSVGGLLAAFTTTGYKVFEGQNYLSMLMALIGILPVLYLASGKRKSAVIATIIIFLCMSLTKRRSLALIYSLMPILTYYNYKVSRIKAKNFLLLLIPVSVYILYIASMRGIASGASQSISNSILGNVVEITRQVQYGENIPDMISAIDSGRIQLQGLNYVFNGILTFIPRGIWSDKPLVESAAIVGQLVYGADVAGHPVGPYGWAYFCFGYIGVFVFGCINGLIVKKIFDWVKREDSLFSYLFYSLTIVKLLEIFAPESQFKILFLTIILIVLSVFSNMFVISRNGLVKNKLSN